ncbi:hypothetical protein OPQ81_007239 [Rhizoctonia solani]|nr:hypothetical protein OPQ81_007239 [Rhizoctonia solani]
MAVKIAVIFYSLYGHIAQLAQEVKKGIESEDVEVTLFQVPETLSPEILTKLGAPPATPKSPLLPLRT